jgi:bacteriorhodopsin
MNRQHYIQVILLITASLIFVSGLSYLNQASTGGVGVIESLYSITNDRENDKESSFSSSSQTYMEPIGLSITEKRGAYIIIGISILILAWVIFSAMNERRKTGRHTVQIPFVAASLLLAITFIAQLFRLGSF